MHFINRGLLKMALLPGGLYRNMGVDVRLLKAILYTKLTIDDRRPNTLQQMRKKEEKPVSAATIGTIIVSAFLGLLYLGAFFFSDDLLTAFTFYFSLFFFMLSASLISDFTSVLIDVRDNYIILPKPVNDRTVVLARVLHIFIHVCKLIVPMCMPGMVYIAIEWGTWAMVAFLLMVLLLTLFVLFFINALYILILKITTPARFQAIISYVQIIFAITLYAGYQLLPRLTEQVEGYRIDPDQQPFVLLLPTYWFAAGWQVLYSGQGSTLQLMAALAGFVLPMAGLFVMIKYLAPTFNNKLALIGSISGTTQGPASTRKAQQKIRYSQLLSRWVTRPGVERMGFLFTWKMMSRGREFKIKVYPAIGYMVVCVFLILFRPNGGRRMDDEIRETAANGAVIGALYITSYVLIVAISHIRQSNQYKAGWMFFTAPLYQPGAVILGAVKAGIFMFFIPLASIVSGFAVVFTGPGVVPNLLLGFLNQVLIVLLIVFVNHKLLPFTQPESVKEKAGAVFKGVLVVIFTGMIGLGHFFIFDVLPAVVLCSILSGIAVWYIMGSIRGTTWDKVYREYDRAG